MKKGCIIDAPKIITKSKTKVMVLSHCSLLAQDVAFQILKYTLHFVMMASFLLCLKVNEILCEYVGNVVKYDHLLLSVLKLQEAAKVPLMQTSQCCS